MIVNPNSIISGVDYLQPTQAILTGSKNLTQTFTASGGETTIILDRVITLSYDNVTVFKNGLLLTPETDYTLGTLTGSAAGDNSTLVDKIIFNGALISGNKITIITNTFSSSYFDLDWVKEYIRTNDLYGNLPLGTIFAYSGKNVPNGALCCDGQTINGCNTTYPQFYDWVVNNASTITMSEYNTFLNNNNDICGHYGLDSSTGTVRLPRLTGLISGITDVSAVGGVATGATGNTKNKITYRYFVQVFSAPEKTGYGNLTRMISDLEKRITALGG